MSWTHQYSVEVDENESGLIYRTFREIYLKNNTISLIYNINTSILHTINTDKIFSKICDASQFNGSFTSNKKLTNANFQNVIDLKMESLDRLENLFNESISKNLSIHCANIHDKMFNFNLTLQRIKNFNSSNFF